MSLSSTINELLMGSAGGYTISNSLRFRSSASAYLNRTPASAGNQQTWTWSGWIKKGNLTVFEHLFGASSSINNRFSFNFDNSVASGTNGDYLCAFIVLGGTTTNLFQTNALFRDPSAWYHIVLAVDTTQATSTNRLKLYVNGNLQTFSTYNAPTQNTAMLVNSAIAHNIASGAYSAGTYTFDGYMAEVNFIDGLALDPSYFGATNTTTGTWAPKRYSGSYGTNGFYLPFSDTSGTTSGSNTGLGKDFSGNGNYWNTSNISLTAGSTYDAMLDSPTPKSTTVGNYAVLNPTNASATGIVIDGNLGVSIGANVTGVAGSIAVTSGKWYWEFTAGSAATNAFYVSICDVTQWSAPGKSQNDMYNSPNVWTYYGNSGQKINNGTVSSYGATFTNGDVIGVALDMDTGSIVFYKNNTSQGTAFTGLTGKSMAAWIGNGASSASVAGAINFGQRPFVYTPPTGFKSLCTYNLPTPSIVNGARYMAATTWSGDGSASRAISNAVNGVSFQPDFTWIKCRSSAQTHVLQDVIRGTTLAATLASSSTAAEGGISAQDYGAVTAYGSTGFTVGQGSQGGGNAAFVNYSGFTYVGWSWKANGTAVTNTAGSITSQVSANPTAGFSVVTYTGTGANATVGHGLGVAPSFIVVSARNVTHDWCAYHQSIGNTSAIFPNLTSASSASINYWNNTSPTSSVFSIGIAGGVNNSSSTTYVAYCFAAIPGYSAFGSYTGNGSSDGPFVFTGFRPRFVLIKGSSFVSNWFIEDSARNGYNVNDGVALRPNLSNAEDGTTTYNLDITSNGFKLRSSSVDSNTSGATFIYAAFAENPFNYSLAR